MQRVGRLIGLRPDQRTPNFASVVQEVVDRPGWASGNAMVVIITGSGKRVAEAYEGDVSGAPHLYIEYTLPTPPPTITPTFTPTATATQTPTVKYPFYIPKISRQTQAF